MTGPELIVIALVYLATLLLGMRGVGAVLPQAQEAGFALAAIVAGVTAALAYKRHHHGAAPTSVKVTVGLLTAAVGVVVGLICQSLWQPMLRPAVSLSIAALATAAAPFLIFPLVRKLTGEDATLDRPRPPLGETHVLAVILIAALLMTVAYVIPVPGRSNVRLVGKYFPSLFVPLPEWKAEQNTARMDFGSIKLQDPKSAGPAVGGGAGAEDAAERFIALRWMDADPVQAEEHIEVIAVGGLRVRERDAAFISRHQGTTFYLESDDRRNRAVATIWNCPQDHRVLWLFSYLSGPKSAMLATHEKILSKTHCHTGRNKEDAATAPPAQYPAFAPPAGFVKQEIPAEPSNGSGAGGAGGAGGARIAIYLAPGGRSIVFDAAVNGKSDLVAADVPPAFVARQLTSNGILATVEGEPALLTSADLQGHPRRTWSITGTAPAPATRGTVQMEVMVWYCDVRDLTFIGRYTSPQKHDPQLGVDAMLPAACHR
jgi:hypothetical protein